MFSGSPRSAHSPLLSEHVQQQLRVPQRLWNPVKWVSLILRAHKTVQDISEKIKFNVCCYAVVYNSYPLQKLNTGQTCHPVIGIQPRNTFCYFLFSVFTFQNLGFHPHLCILHSHKNDQFVVLYPSDTNETTGLQGCFYMGIRPGASAQKVNKITPPTF